MSASSLLLHPRRSVLVLVDYQARLLPAIDNGEVALAHAVRLADVARKLGVPVLGTEENPAGLGQNVAPIRDRCDATLQKMHFDACADGLLDAIQDTRVTPLRDIVIAGCEAHVCLLQTALGLLQAGYRVSVVAEACGSRSAPNVELAMQRLRQNGATIVSVEMVAFEWLGSCEDACFKQVLALLKAPII
ncbi:MAG: isochorismatase family protein [Usitatibacteraceae bacterium]